MVYVSVRISDLEYRLQSSRRDSLALMAEKVQVAFAASSVLAREHCIYSVWGAGWSLPTSVMVKPP